MRRLLLVASTIGALTIGAGAAQAGTPVGTSTGTIIIAWTVATTRQFDMCNRTSSTIRRCTLHRRFMPRRQSWWLHQPVLCRCVDGISVSSSDSNIVNQIRPRRPDPRGDSAAGVPRGYLQDFDETTN